jgi:hypothetical protein
MKSPRASRIIAVFIAALVISGLGAGAAAAAACPTPSKGPNDLPSGFSPYLGFSMHIEDAPYEFTGFDGGPLYSTEVRPGQTLVVDGIFNNCDFPGVVVWSSVSAAITDERGRPAAGGQVTLEPGAQGDLGQPALSDTGVLAWAGSLSASREYRVAQARVRFKRAGRYRVAVRRPGVDRPGEPSAPTAPDNTIVTSVKVTVRGKPVGVGGGAGGLSRDARVYAATCVEAAEPIVARAPTRRAARAGAPRVRLRGRQRVCSARKRLSRRQAQKAWRLPSVPSPVPTGDAPVPAGCLLAPGTVDLALSGVLLSRRSWCSRARQVDAIAVVRIISQTGIEDREVGRGRVSIAQAVTFDTRGGADARVELGYLGLSGTIRALATFQARMRCEFTFETTCAAEPRDTGTVALLTGTTGATDIRLEPGAIARGNRDVMQIWLELRLRAFASGGIGTPVVVTAAPRPRCDTEAPGQGCVWADFTPTLAFSNALVPEIAAHVTQAQTAGQPGAPGTAPLTRTARANVAANRRAACPAAIRRAFRRQRPDGSCDEYPFASTSQGGPGASRANVGVRQNSIQGGLTSAFYRTQRVLTNDAFWVTTTP